MKNLFWSLRSDDERRHCKKYSVGLTAFNAGINIPPELDSPEVFHPTLGPKVKWNIFIISLKLS